MWEEHHIIWRFHQTWKLSIVKIKPHNSPPNNDLKKQSFAISFYRLMFCWIRLFAAEVDNCKTHSINVPLYMIVIIIYLTIDICMMHCTGIWTQYFCIYGSLTFLVVCARKTRLFWYSMFLLSFVSIEIILLQLDITIFFCTVSKSCFI